MEAILVPTDFSETAGYALEFAAEYARELELELHVIHVVDPGIFYDLFMEDAELRIEGETKMADLLKSEFLAGLAVKPVVTVGDVGMRIVKYADIINADLIILGSQGTGNLGQFMVGSTAQKVVRNTEKDVLTIKHRVNSIKLKNVVFASHFGAGTELAFDHLFEYVKHFYPTIHLLMTNTRGENSKNYSSAMERVNAFNELITAKYNVRTEKVVVNAKKKEFGIMEYSMQKSIDMIAIRTHAAGGIWRLFKESVSQDLVNHSYRPVLTINTDDE